MRQVAELAGVSVQTVSNHVNGRHQYMAEGTRARVADAMRELGYYPNLTARGLRSAETRVLGFLVLDEHARFLADPLTDLVMAGIGDVARESDYGILIQSSTPKETPDRLVTPLLQSRVDGAFLLLSGERAAREAHIERTAAITREFLVFDELINDPDIMSVRAANREGGREIASHLISQGHERIAFVGAAVPWAVVEQRFAGFKDAIRASGLELHSDLVRMEAGWEPASAVPIAESLLKLEKPPTAIMCSTDLLALATIHAARRLGFQVPSQLAVSGFDDFQFAHFASPALTTVRIPAYDMGREAARMLIGHLHDGDKKPAEVEQVEFPVELVIREST
jgi:DNA-binding LacI/PurR family transcriptional regulator